MCVIKVPGGIVSILVLTAILFVLVSGMLNETGSQQVIFCKMINQIIHEDIIYIHWIILIFFVFFYIKKRMLLVI